MNKTVLLGRLTKEPEVKKVGQQNLSCAQFTVAVDRRFKDANGNRQADFINCVAWRQSADLLGKYFHKGNKIGIVGSIQTRTYDDQNGNKVYVTEVLVEEIHFVESASQKAETTPAPTPVAPQEPIAAEPDLPFDF